jgi:hypothetical protein
MPRRNRRYRSGWSKGPTEVEPPPPTYEGMARRLVARGLASPLILDHHRVTTTSTEGTAQ